MRVTVGILYRFRLLTLSNPDQVDLHSGYLIGPPGDQADAPFNFYFTDVELSTGAEYVAPVDRL